jgi:hypothetical protein
MEAAEQIDPIEKVFTGKELRSFVRIHRILRRNNFTADDLDKYITDGLTVRRGYPIEVLTDKTARKEWLLTVMVEQRPMMKKKILATRKKIWAKQKTGSFGVP